MLTVVLKILARQPTSEPPVNNLVNSHSDFLALLQEPLFEEATRIVATPPYTVPNIVHYIWFARDENQPLSFINYVSILSAHRIQRPQLILLHCNHLPSGKWWRKLSRRVPVRIVHREPPRTIFNQSIKHIYHAADVTKLQLMQTYGGIYLDADVIVLNSLDPLRLYNATLGKERPPKLIAGIMIGAPGAAFFRIVYESYRGDYRGDDWDYNCARRPFELYTKYPHLLHVEPYKLTTPDFIDRHLLFDGLIDWRHLYVIHIMGHLMSQSTIGPQNIRTLQTTFGEVMRYVYYGSSAVRP